MAIRLQLKYIMSNAANAEGGSAIGLQEVHNTSLVNDFVKLVNNQQHVDDSFLITATATTSETSSFRPALVRFQESAQGTAFGYDSDLTSSTYQQFYNSVKNDNVSESSLKRYRTPKYINSSLSNEELSGQFLPSLLVSSADNTNVYDILKQYLSVSQLSYSPMYSPLFMKKKLLSTFVGRNDRGEYKVVWNEYMPGDQIPQKALQTHAQMNYIDQWFISEYMVPTLVYDTNAFVTSANLNKSDNTEDARYALTLKYNGSQNQNITNITALKTAIQNNKLVGHSDDMIGLNNFYLPYHLYMNQISWCLIPSNKILTDNSYNENNANDTIKLQGIIDKNDSIQGVKLVVDAKNLVDGKSITAGELPTTSTRIYNTSQLSQKMSVSELWSLQKAADMQTTLNQNCMEYPLSVMYIPEDNSENSGNVGGVGGSESHGGTNGTISTEYVKAGWSNALNNVINKTQLTPYKPQFDETIEHSESKDAIARGIMGGQYASVVSAINSQGLIKGDFSIPTKPQKAGSLLYNSNSIMLTSETGESVKPANVEIVSTKTINNSGIISHTYGDVKLRTGFNGLAYVKSSEEPQEIKNGSSIHLFTQTVQTGESGESTETTFHKIDICAGNEYDSYCLDKTKCENNSNELQVSRQPGCIQLKSYLAREPKEIGEEALNYSGITISDEVIIQSAATNGIKFVVADDNNYYVISLLDIIHKIFGDELNGIPKSDNITCDKFINSEYKGVRESSYNTNGGQVTINWENNWNHASLGE